MNQPTAELYFGSRSYYYIRNTPKQRRGADPVLLSTKQPIRPQQQMLNPAHLSVLKSEVTGVNQVVGRLAHGRAHHDRRLLLFRHKELHQRGYLPQPLRRR